MQLQCKSQVANNRYWINTWSRVAIEPWHASNKTRLVSPSIGWSCSLSFRELISSHPVMKTNTAPGFSFSQILHKRYSIRLKPRQSGFQHDKDSCVSLLYSLNIATLSESCYNFQVNDGTINTKNLIILLFTGDYLHTSTAEAIWLFLFLEVCLFILHVFSSP